MRIERYWVEVNSRVNYPLKQALQEMEEAGDINMDDTCDRFCTSWVAIRVARVGVQRQVQAWNNHTIRGKNKHNKQTVTFRTQYVCVLFTIHI